MKSNRVMLCAAGAALSATAGAWATPIVFTGSSGMLAASAEFSTSGNSLIVTLTNNSTGDVLVPVDVLTAVFFNINGAPVGLERTSAVLGAGASVVFGGSDPGGVVGGEWAYADALVGAPGGASHGLSSTGLGLFGPSQVFPGSNLQGPAEPDGLQYGIIPLSDDTATGNNPVTGANALIRRQVVFSLLGLPAGFDPAARITGVSFQYGTRLEDPNIPGTPAPGVLALLAAAGLTAARRRR